MTLEQFKNSIYHTRTSVVVPSLGRMRIDKTYFMVKGKFQTHLLDDYLNKLYKKNKLKQNKNE